MKRIVKRLFRTIFRALPTLIWVCGAIMLYISVAADETSLAAGEGLPKNTIYYALAGLAALFVGSVWSKNRGAKKC